MARAPKPQPRRDLGRPRGAPIADVVLARTLEELAEHGLAGLSVERIARAAEVNKTSVYRRWPTRGALVAAALERVHDDLVADLPETGSLRGDLLAMAEGIVRLLRKPLGRELARAAFAEDADPELAALAASRLGGRAAGPALAMVRRARERGELRDDVDPGLLLDLVAGSILHRAMLVRSPPTRAWLASMVDVIAAGAAPHGKKS
jgi:AcrR family transcriptional regulator